jgi:hypothetical protein
MAVSFQIHLQDQAGHPIQVREYCLPQSVRLCLGCAWTERLFRTAPTVSDSGRSVNVAKANWGHASYRRRLASQKSPFIRYMSLWLSARRRERPDAPRVC